ncbi:MAG: PorT family protein [Muribaculaceae bacterium]|nr:PorT family protein [Muribaculaceae bacterium]
MKATFCTLTLLISSLMPVTTFADDFTSTDSSRDAFGVRAGVEISSAAGAPDYYSNGAGGSAGVVYTKYFYKDFYVEPGAYLFYDTFGQTVETALPTEQMPAVADGSIRNFGFRVPVNAGCRLALTDDMGLKFFTGPQMNVSLIARSHFDDKDIPDEGNILGKKGFKRFDLQWNFGVGLDYNRWFVGVSASAGVTKVMNRTFEHFRRNYACISVGYTF